MATRFRSSFTYFKSIFHKNSTLNKIHPQRQTFYCYSKDSSTGRTLGKTALYIFGTSCGMFGLYSYVAPDRKKRLEAVSLKEKDYIVRYEIPDIQPSREVKGPAADLDLDLTLYQYQTCPFCCKVRAFLDFHGIPYKVIEVNPVMRQQLKFSSYKKVPIIIAKGKNSNVMYQLNDSSVIISILGTFLLDSNEELQDVLKLYVPHVSINEKGKEEEDVLNKYFLMYGNKVSSGRTEEVINKEREWRKWADKEFVHILSPNIYRTYDEALQAFNYFSEVGEWEKNFSTFERMTVIYVGATAMYLIGKKLKKKYSLKPDVRESLYDACNQWMKAIGSKQKFMGGDQPNLADLAVYGLLNSIEGCLAFQDLLKRTSIGTWYYRVQDAVSDHAGYKLKQ